MSFVLGVDGGTSKTKALIATLDGTVVGHAKTGGSNVYDGDLQVGLANAMQAPAEAISLAGIATELIETSLFSMSGADWSEDMLMFRASARAQGFGRRIDVVNDAIGGLYAGRPESSCVAVICGTHAACAARGADGSLWHNSFWQMSGGAHNLGSAALRAVYQSDLGILDQTSLTAAILEYFGESTPESLLHRQTALFADPFPDVALLTPLLFDHADTGDLVSREIVTAHGRDLARYALAAARKVGIEAGEYELILGGSVFRHSSSVLPDAIADAMRERSPKLATVKFRVHEPVVGALLLAFENHGVSITDDLVGRIIETLPSGWY
jgi:N-acetylglucosamine kinase-like BadF-type ATPase